MKIPINIGNIFFHKSFVHIALFAAFVVEFILLTKYKGVFGVYFSPVLILLAELAYLFCPFLFHY